MSLSISTDTVTDVLLADGWHRVKDLSFELNAYEFVSSGDFLVLGDGACEGFTFITGNCTRIVGPLTALLGVRWILPHAFVPQQATTS